ncbi:hypothetical protein A5656_28185 [Mycobacterium gordonae]|nr:hypothetical protein A5656_28185 [Mycobacterium gordonae]
MTLEGKPEYCERCGFVITVLSHDTTSTTRGRMPQCPRCRNPVRVGDFPRSDGGSPQPWNADWPGTCEQCEFDFTANHAQDIRDWLGLPRDVELPESMEVRRRIAVRPAARSYWWCGDQSLALAGIEVEFESSSHGTSGSFFLTKDEAAWLVRTLAGSLAICFEQYHWNNDHT